MQIIKIIILILLGFVLGYAISGLNSPTNTTSKSSRVDGKTIKIEQSTCVEPADEITHLAIKTPVTIAPAEASKQPDKQEQIEKLNSQYQQLETRYQQARKKLARLEWQVYQQRTSDVTDDELTAFFPDKFSNLVSDVIGEFRNEVYEFHKKDNDQDMAYELTQSINDFIITHDKAYDVELVALTCKQKDCEILLVEKQAHSWEAIINDMRQQTWWQFQSTNGRSSSDVDGNNIFYVFLQAYQKS